MRIISLAVGTLMAASVVAACEGSGIDAGLATPDGADAGDVGTPDSGSGDSGLRDAGSGDSGSADSGPKETPTFGIGGTVAGLTGSGLVLQLNGGSDLPVSAAGKFSFPTKLAKGATYEVSVKTQPSTPAETCTVSGGTGTVGSADVSSITVNCAATLFTIGGTASGLAGTAVLQNNGADDLTVSANGAFAFAAPMKDGEAYAVTVKTQPGAPVQTCTLADASGTVAAANVTNIALSCVTQTFKTKVAVTGLAGTGLVLQNNGKDDLAVAADGSFTFATPVLSGAAFAVTVKATPAGQVCHATNATGTIGAADVTNVTVTCNSCDGYGYGGGCWYVSDSAGQSCTTVCAAHGGFDAAHAQHTGNSICSQFFPSKTSGRDWMPTECCSTDNNTNWGANGATPDPNWTHSFCHVACACNE